jgi:hypothetical protein
MTEQARGLIRIALVVSLPFGASSAREFHVSAKGNDTAQGSVSAPLKTISAAAQLAQPGDTITVHAGTYRERITPPRGGESDTKRIVYQAAPGEEVVIKGSEVVRGWKQLSGGIWKAILPNSFFGGYNPYKDVIEGDWFDAKGRTHHTGAVYLNGKALLESTTQPAARLTWFCENDEKNTFIYANFSDSDPNRELVEINVRDAVFYPDKPGRNYITVRGFRMAHAATQWAAPTAEQIGLIGTHWSKGWIIENNVISDSKCSGITLGKDRASGHNVWTKDPAKDGATHYNEVIVRALKAGWSRANIGSHIVRNNTIFDCEQAGIAGSMGAVFSQISNNHIYNIWTRRQFAGAEMAGIKLHGAIDVVIRNNRIHKAGRGLWMDWMAQGTRITGNLLYDNSTDDLFVEVNHGPFVVDNNLFLSGVSLRDWSEGGAYVHNVIAGQIISRPEPRRSTPYHKAHSTELAGLAKTTGGDDRFYNNLFTSAVDLAQYEPREFPIRTEGNVIVGHWKPAVIEEGDSGYLFLPPASSPGRLVTTELLGKTKVSGLPYENADGTLLVIDIDYFGRKRPSTTVSPGPFEGAVGRIRLW